MLVPLVSVTAALTLQPALLSYGGRRLLGRTRGGAFWGRVARRVMARPWHVLAGGVALMAALAAPAARMQLTPGSLTGIPASAAQSVRGYNALSNALGGGLVTPTHIVVVDGGAAATKRLVDELVHDPESLVIASGKHPPYVAGGGRYRQVVVANRHPWGSATTRRFVHRVRDRLVPAARFPSGARVYAGGAPAQGADFIARAYGAFPWLIALVVAFTYVVLRIAFKSLVLPLKALVLNALSVGAAYGILVLVFDHPIEAWIPIFLFAALFGLSMDYEVFMVSRMREAHDAGESDVDAVSHGLERTGPVVSACAAVMVVAFTGFAVGRIEGLREFGVGLAAAVALDATVVRGLLLPSAMAVLGRWNWRA